MLHVHSDAMLRHYDLSLKQSHQESRTSINVKQSSILNFYFCVSVAGVPLSLESVSDHLEAPKLPI